MVYFGEQGGENTHCIQCVFNCNVTGFVWFVFPGGLQGTDWLLTAVRCVEKSRTAHQKTSAGADEHGKETKAAFKSIFMPFPR